MFYRHFLDVEGVECCGADDHLQAFAVRCRFWYLFIDAFDEVAVACRQQPILQEELKLTHDVTLTFEVFVRFTRDGTGANENQEVLVSSRPSRFRKFRIK